MDRPQQQAVDTFLPYMVDVTRWKHCLQELNQMWHLIEATAKMNCSAEARLLLPSIIATRTGFAQLECDLVTNLVQEKVQQVLAELSTRAQYMIDIVVRNLFERTADVGFLATDSELCRFVAGLDHDGEGARQRLADYRAKYTVYDAILVLDLAGRVLLQTDESAALVASKDPLLAATLAQPDYVETFRASDLRPGKAHALIYSQRMLHPDTGEPIGVLCLSFHFEQEMEAIFTTYRDPVRRANMLLLDRANRVIASADPLWIPVGATVPTGREAGAQVQIYCGRAYLVRTFASPGYQNYPGPEGWKGQVMVPLELAFGADESKRLEQLAPQLLQGVLSHAHTFNPALHGLMAAVTQTSRTIKRIVWNGKVTTAGAVGDAAGDGKLNSVLDQIAETGQRADDVFSRSIKDLYQTVLAARIHSAESTSQLLVDLLDRNLYERANDCRWWALTPQLRRSLAQPGNPGDPGQSGDMCAVLDHINRLYPVYRRILVYDRSGRIVASSRGAVPAGATVGAATAARVCALATAQDHHGEPFGPSPLYDDESTFIYHAAIRHPQQEANVVGGIGIVFDAKPELLNMLRSGVAARPNMHACFVAPDGRVLAATDPACAPGSRLALDVELFKAAGTDGASASRIVVHDGQYKIAAATKARGYREFRNGSAVEDEVIGVVLESFGPVRDARHLSDNSTTRIAADSDSGRDFAIFRAGHGLLALPAAIVKEAVPFSRVRALAAGSACVGMLNPQASDQPFIWVFDLGRLLTGRASTTNQDSQVILVRNTRGTVGLLVDDLHSVHRFSDGDIAPCPLSTDEHALSTRLIKANGGGLLIPEIDVDCLFAQLLGTTRATSYSAVAPASS